MITETLDELRERLLRQESVQRMIQVRAYEIYQMRGCTPGGEAHDWFHAEAEVLAFLLADESTRNDEQPGPVPAPRAAAAGTPKRRASAKSAAAKSAAPKKPAPKRASRKKSAGSKSGATRTSRKSKPEET